MLCISGNQAIRVVLQYGMDKLQIIIRDSEYCRLVAGTLEYKPAKNHDWLFLSAGEKLNFL